MSKKVAVLAVNPVNGLGLFTYLENFFENKIAYRVFAVSDSTDIKTNSGVALKADALVADLAGHAADYDAMVFSCGDAMPVFAQHADAPYNQMLIQVIKEFAGAGKLLIGHCGAGVLFDLAGVTAGKQVTCHPYVKDMVKNATYVDAPYCIDDNIYTAAEEKELHLMMPEVVKVLK
ncbi:DJ-1/PfpI family protein [Hoylesella enoeca]|uniref:Protease n=1 Tax=Hoylesella enoeca TaxID=76123 RepID=A0A0S2KMK2_9BACT|nr:DJ-1/PfpI family protein [Hoylesella enoeca]ALO49520.1 protease [Hoylesella enoeca]